MLRTCFINWMVGACLVHVVEGSVIEYNYNELILDNYHNYKMIIVTVIHKKSPER